MQIERFKIEGHSGYEMAAELDLPDEGKPEYFTIYVPCFSCSKNIRVLKNISKRLVANGIGLLRFDFPGLGESEGDFAESNYSTNLKNIRLAAKWLEDNYEAPKLGIGHSMGGSAMMKFAQEYEPLQAVVTIAAPHRPRHLADILIKKKKIADTEGSANIVIGGNEYTLTKEFFDDLIDNSDDYSLEGLNKPILVMHSPDDNTVSLDEARKILAEVRGQRSYVMLNNYGHLIMDEEHSRKTADIIYHWAKMYL